MKDEKGSSVGGQFVKNSFNLAVIAKELASSKPQGTHFDFNTDKDVTREKAVSILKK